MQTHIENKYRRKALYTNFDVDTYKTNNKIFKNWWANKIHMFGVYFKNRLFGFPFLIVTHLPYSFL